MDYAIAGAIIASMTSLILGIYNAALQAKLKREEEQGEKPVRDASATKILSEASELVAKQYGELLDRVKEDFKEKLLEIREEVGILKEEMKIKNATILHLELENDKLKLRVAELETELKAWKVSSGIQ